MRREERQTLILDILYNKERVEVDALAEKFDVSQETIRRDLTSLAERGLLRKVHGGAVRFQTAQEDTFTLRSQVNHAAKSRVGEYAAQFINDGDSLFMNAGTTTAVFTEHLIDKQHLTVVTNCARIAEMLWSYDQDHKIFLLGGQYNGTDTETNGSLVLQQIGLFRCDHAVITLGAVDVDGGLMEYRVEAADVIRAMIEQAQTATAIVDSSKLHRSALFKIGELSVVTRIVTDSLPSPELIQAIVEAGVELHVPDAVIENA